AQPPAVAGGIPQRVVGIIRIEHADEIIAHPKAIVAVRPAAGVVPVEAEQVAVIVNRNAVRAGETSVIIANRRVIVAMPNTRLAHAEEAVVQAARRRVVAIFDSLPAVKINRVVSKSILV